LTSKYDELKTKYDVLTKGPTTVTEKAVEQAIFNLINQTRRGKG